MFVFEFLRFSFSDLNAAYAARFLYRYWPLPVDNLGSGVVVARATISGIKQRAGTGVVPGVLSSGWWIWVGKCGCTCASVSRGRVYLYLS